MIFPSDYIERVYAGVLGKIIGVYLGRPIEGWTFEKIAAELGEISFFVHDRPNPDLHTHTLVVTDDDISGTFTFPRALEDLDATFDVAPAQIAQTWLNYVIEGRTIFWWGGMGNSTEHTAYLRLKSGIPAPGSGSIALNGKVVAEQIGAQIFIDGWAMLAPGDPERAADLAQRAASVSHDGEAIYGARLLAAMEAQAFTEGNRDKLVQTGLACIPRNSLIYRLVNDICEWHAQYTDWHIARERIAAEYGYDRFGGNCHIIPNHALIHLGFLYGDDDFQKSLMITNTCGWDTDCNSGNLGCLLGIKNGLAGLEGGPDWRGAVADRMYLSTADGGRAITDAAAESVRLVNLARALQAEAPLVFKNGARFHFSLPGSVQGFTAEEPGLLSLDNATPRGLALRYRHVAPGRPARAGTATFIPPEAIALKGYPLLASPTLYSGQTVRAAFEASAQNNIPIAVRVYVSQYGAGNRLERLYGPQIGLAPGERRSVEWHLENMGVDPIAEIGIELAANRRADGVLYLDWLTWDGTPIVTFTRPPHDGTMWRRAWVDSVDHFDIEWPEAFRLVQDRGTGLLMQGTREWTDYAVRATLVPHMVKSFGIAARVQGLERYYALLIGSDNRVRLVKMMYGAAILAAADMPLVLGEPYSLCLQVEGAQLRAQVNQHQVLEVVDPQHPLAGGGIALVCEEGRVATEQVEVFPIAGRNSREWV